MKQSISGILLLDKPLGMSSNQALQKVKHLYIDALGLRDLPGFRVKSFKAGHTGALDPLATGLLPICFGDATKFTQYLLDADKHYQTIAKLGERTTTCDAEGELIASASVNDITQEKIESVLKKFRGDIEQIPSMYSALKHQGQPLYKLARQGVEVERKARPITISSLQASHINSDQLALDVHCSKGTYIRNLVDDIGEALACYAYVKSLRRLGTGPFKITEAVTLEDLKQKNKTELLALLLPPDAMLLHLPRLDLDEKSALQIRHGQAVRLLDSDQQSLFSESGLARLYNQAGHFLGLGRLDESDLLIAKRLCVI